ncbi:F-box domain-containing protein [Mycena kentingensis (nom. inval.)]|nr:F-box domain-containing protein [Mycena kentingensis (nom. inval.)]
MLQLLDLDPDVMLCILSWCSIRSVIRSSQTCKTLLELTLEKTLWITLLRDLRNRGIFHARILDETRAVCTADLVDEAKRVVFGPEDDSPGMLDARMGLPSPSVKLCGGRGDGEVVWRRASAGTGLRGNHCPAYAVDVLYGGEVARVLLFPREDEPLRSGTSSLIQVQEVDLKFGRDHRELFSAELQNCSMGSPEIVGDFGVGVLWTACEIAGHWCSWLLFDWREQSGIVVSWDHVCRMVLVRGYLVVLATSFDSYEIRVFPLDALRRKHFRPMGFRKRNITEWPRIDISQMDAEAFHVMRGPTSERAPYGFSLEYLSAHQHPLDPDIYRIRFFAQKDQSLLHLGTWTLGDLYCVDLHFTDCGPVFGAPRWWPCVSPEEGRRIGFAAYPTVPAHDYDSEKDTIEDEGTVPLSPLGLNSLAPPFPFFV